MKLAPPEMRPDLEAAALTLWAGRGSVRLVDFAHDIGGLLLERLVPASHLPPGEDAVATDLVARPLMELHAVQLPASHPFPTQLEFVDVWLDRVRLGGESETAGVHLVHCSKPLRVPLEFCRYGVVAGESFSRFSFVIRAGVNVSSRSTILNARFQTCGHSK